MQADRGSQHHNQDTTVSQITKLPVSSFIVPATPKHQPLMAIALFVIILWFPFATWHIIVHRQ